MKSGKQRRQEIMDRRRQKAERAAQHEVIRPPSPATAPCNPSKLAPYNSYGCPPFVERGYYLDTPFRCRDCGVEELWRATQQKWWYEVAKGHVETRATRCRGCRRKERERRAEADRARLAGLERKRRRPV